MTSHCGELAAIGTALLWTLSALAWTSAGRRIGVVSVCVIRLVMAVLLLALYGQLTRGLALPVDASARQWWILGLSGWLGFFVSDLCLFKAFQLIGPRLSLLLVGAHAAGRRRHCLGLPGRAPGRPTVAGHGRDPRGHCLGRARTPAGR